MKEITLNVKGMMCAGCERRVVNALTAFKGVENASADHVSGKVTVSAKEKVAEEELCSAIEAIGFEVEK